VTAEAPAALDVVLREARRAAFGPAEFVGQESFVTASEVLALARRAGVGPGISVLDLCCGTGGPGLSVTRTLGCDYLGVDADPGSVAQARRRAAAVSLDARFAVARVPPVPPGPFDVVLLLETMLAFRDKPALLRGVSAALRTGGRFAFTLEEGSPLTEAERAAMPGSGTVWLTPLDDLLAELEAAGLWVHWLGECSRQHRVAVDALVGAYSASAPHLGAGAGSGVVDDLVTSHRLWSRWLAEGRVRKFAVVADKVRA
jgi:SAM-dependent methyltransferase